MDKQLGIIPLKKIKKEVKKIEEKLVHGNYGNFIKGQKLDKKKEKKYTKPPYADLAASVDLEGEMLDEKALSKSQQRFMGMVYAYLKGEMPNASDEVKKAAKGMSKKDAKKYASTKHAKLPEKVEENTAIESELLIQDWNKDDIKFTEIETVDIIKPKPLRPSPSNWREDLGEDWQKVNRKDKTDGLSKKAVKAYRRENPGSKLQTAVTTKPSKLKKGSKSAKRRLSFCRRMKGMKKKLTSAKTRRDPDSRINKALRRWNC